MKKKITLAVLIAVVTLGLTACTNTEVSSVGTTTTPVTTPVVTTVNTTTTEATTTSEQLTTEPNSDVVTSEEQTEAVVSDETTTSEQKEVTTTTSEQLGSTTTSKKSTTTVGTTTTKKPTTVTTTKKATTTTTTTKKKTTTTTTTKKKTTTTTTAKKQEITTTTSPVIKITQSDVDKLVNELQEYSTNKHFEINKERVLSEIEEYKDVLPTGYDWEDYKNEVISAIPTFTPSNSSWNGPNAYSPTDSYDYVLQSVKESIDSTYYWSPNCHIVVYAKWCPDGEGCCNEFVTSDCWDFYLLR